tara:strand:+ start:2853 stop:3074 length:222 start_codon:yes stop_codon:yes gene_type:complete
MYIFIYSFIKKTGLCKLLRTTRQPDDFRKNSKTGYKSGKNWLQPFENAVYPVYADWVQNWVQMGTFSGGAHAF